MKSDTPHAVFLVLETVGGCEVYALYWPPACGGERNLSCSVLLNVEEGSNIFLAEASTHSEAYVAREMAIGVEKCGSWDVLATERGVEFHSL